MKALCFEALESRRLAAVSGVSLLGPQAIGWEAVAETTSTSRDGTTTTYDRIVGRGTTNGVRTTKHAIRQEDSSFGAIDAAVLTHISADETRGVRFHSTRTTIETPQFSSLTIVTPGEPHVVLPAELVPRERHHFTERTKASTTTRITIGGALSEDNTVARTTQRVSIWLVSNRTRKISVPAGTFSCYLVRTARNDVTGSARLSTVTDNYYARGYGIVFSTTADVHGNLQGSTQLVSLRNAESFASRGNPPAVQANKTCDTSVGGAGGSTLVGNSGDDRINGSGGRELIFGAEGADRLYGNGGDDTLGGRGGVDRLFGGDRDDSLVGRSSNDKLYGEAGDDVLFGGTGADLLDGGFRSDAAIVEPYDSRLAIEVLS